MPDKSFKSDKIAQMINKKNLKRLSTGLAISLDFLVFGLYALYLLYGLFSGDSRFISVAFLLVLGFFVFILPAVVAIRLPYSGGVVLLIVGGAITFFAALSGLSTAGSFIALVSGLAVTGSGVLFIAGSERIKKDVSSE